MKGWWRVERCVWFFVAAVGEEAGLPRIHGLERRKRLLRRARMVTGVARG